MCRFSLLFLFCLIVINSQKVAFSEVTETATTTENVDRMFILKLIEKMDILERKVAATEKNERQTKESIRALIETNARLRLKITELEQRCTEKDAETKGKESDNFTRSIQNSDRDKRQTQSQTQKVAFSAFLDHSIKTLGRDQAIVYNRILLNDGGAYNSNTGIFSVPASGVYLFSWAATARKLSGEHAYDIWVKLQVNGAHQAGCVAESRDDSDDNQGSNSVVLRVNEGDQVWTAHYSSYPDIYGDDNERTTSFSGVLLYEDQ